MLKRTLAGVVLSMAMMGFATAEFAAILSNGSTPCGDFIAAPWQGKQMYLGWALGYISGQNSMDRGAMRGVGTRWTTDSINVWLQNYCSENPLHAFASAVEKLRQELAAQEGLLPH